MLQVDEEALICDLAETYNIYRMKDFSPAEIATFAKGLRENSRIKLLINDEKISLETTLQASIVDRLSLLVWLNSSDGAEGINKPDSILKLLRNETEKSSDTCSYETIEEYEAERNRIL